MIHLQVNLLKIKTLPLSLECLFWHCGFFSAIGSSFNKLPCPDSLNDTLST
jgi:hypothetical protein